jgi:hypothetical protein
MLRTHQNPCSSRRRLAAVLLTSLLAVTALAGCARSQSDQPGENQEAIPGESTSTATPDVEVTDDDSGVPTDEPVDPDSPSPPQTIIAPERPSEESASAQSAGEG